MDRALFEIHLSIGQLLGTAAVFATIIIFCFFRWRKRLLEIAAIMSLLIGIAVLAQIPFSAGYVRQGGINWSLGQNRGDVGIGFFSDRGHALYRLEIYGTGTLPWQMIIAVAQQRSGFGPFDQEHSISKGWPFVNQTLGIQAGHSKIGSPSPEMFWVYVPHWLPLVLFCPWFPLIWYLRRRRRLRQRGFPIAPPTTTTTPSADLPS